MMSRRMSPPPNLPSTCEAEILALIDFPGHVARTGNSLQISLRQVTLTHRLVLSEIFEFYSIRQRGNRKGRTFVRY